MRVRHATVRSTTDQPGGTPSPPLPPGALRALDKYLVRTVRTMSRALPRRPYSNGTEAGIRVVRPEQPLILRVNRDTESSTHPSRQSRAWHRVRSLESRQAESGTHGNAGAAIHGRSRTSKTQLPERPWRRTAAGARARHCGDGYAPIQEPLGRDEMSELDGHDRPPAIMAKSQWRIARREPAADAHEDNQVRTRRHIALL